MSFQIKPLTRSEFDHLFDLSTEQLASVRAMRMIATRKPGFPCRVSSVDAEIGEEVLLAHYQHQSANTPFRASHAVFVRTTAIEARLRPGDVPELFRSRTISLRAFDNKGMLLMADLAEGTAIKEYIEAILENPAVSYIHLHFAKAGCYAARADRVSPTVTAA